MKLRKVRKVT